MHNDAREALGKAKEHVAAGDPDSLRYACLDLRSAIEHLFYELLPLYEDELPTDIVNTWQPAQIIEARVDCDPLVEQDTRICIFDYDEQGQPNTPHDLGEQKAVSRKLLKKYYHALGFYLHAPMPGKPHDYAKLVKRLVETVKVVEDRCSGRVLSNISAKATFTCNCGRRVVRNMRAIEKSPIVTCPDSKCGAMFEYVGTKDGMTEFNYLVETMTCEKCRKEFEFGRHLVQDGRILSCENCGNRVVFVRGLHVEPIDDE